MEGLIEYDDWLVFDDKGVELIRKGSNGSTTLHIFNDFQYQMHFEALKQPSKYLTVIPYSEPWKRIKTNGYKAKEEAKNLFGSTYPMELSQGKIGKIIVKEVKFMKDKTIIYYTAEGIAPYSQASCLYLRDENNKPVEAHDGFNIRKDLKFKITLEK